MNISGGVAPFLIEWTPEIIIDEILVSVEDANECTAEATANCIINRVFEMQGLEYFSLSPNPTTGIFRIAAGFSSEKTVEITVKNVTGQEILSRKIKTRELEESLDLSHQTSGLYFVEMISSGERVIGKLVLSE